jgi:pectate lyase
MFSTVQKPAVRPRYSLPSVFPCALVALCGVLLLGLPASAWASISFDAASSRASTTSLSSLSWSHTLGAGTDRIVIIGVAAENSTAANAAVAGVTFNGVAATAVPNSLISGGGTGIIETELFYVLNSSLPAPGTYTIQVTFHGSIQGASTGAISLFGVNQSAPESVATSVDTSGADSIATSITTHTNGAWVVDVAGSGNSGTFTAASGQSLRWGIAASGMTGASSTRPVATAGSTTLSWTHSGANRLAHSLASFAPSSGGTANCTLTTTTSGPGTVSQTPGGTTFACGTSVTLTATANAGAAFTGWTGGVTSSANPLTFTVNANTSVTANFATQTANCTLTTAASGPGTVSSTPGGTTFACGTSVTLTATPNAGATFTGWTGGVTGSANPLTFTLSANTSVTGNFTTSGTTPDFHLFGFAAGLTTGGKGGQTVTVSTLADLQTQAASTSPLIIQISGKITGTTGSDIVRVASNKTIVGLGSTAELFAVELTLQNSSNIIVRNLKISHVLASNNDGDLIHLQETHNVWIDHCELFNEPPQTQPNKDLYDGLVDITHNSSNVTISWTFFHDHWKSNLIGSSDSDNFDRRTTFHHNMYQNIASRTPSYRFGNGHVYNTYFTGLTISGVNSRMGAVLRVEGNVFENSSDPITSLDSSTVGFWDVRDNQFTNCTGSQPATSNGTFVPPYTYHLDSSSSVKALVTQWVGVGKTDPLQNLP